MEMKKAEDCETVEEVHACLKALEEDKRPLRNAKDLDRMELEIISYTNRLAALLLKKTSKFV